MVKLSTGFPKVEITEVNQSKPSWSRVKLIDGVLGDSEGCFVPQEMVLYVGVPPIDNPNLDSDDESEESSYDDEDAYDANEDTYDASAHATKVKTNPTTTTTKTDTSFITPAPASTQKGVIDVSSNPFSKRLSEVTHVMKLKARECVSPRRLLPSPTSDGSDGSDSSDDNNKKKKLDLPAQLPTQLRTALQMFLDASLTRPPHSQPSWLDFACMRPPTWQWCCSSASQNWFSTWRYQMLSSCWMDP